MNILVSACLLGVNCKYNQKNNQCLQVIELKREHHLIPICPEIMGGLPTPRTLAEVKGERVITRSGEDVTECFQKGAREALKMAEQFDCTYAILKEKSPSCGSGRIYDGTFTKTLIDGDGITAQLLKKHDVFVVGETKYEQGRMEK